MRDDNDRDTKGLVSNDDDDLSFDDYVCLGFIVAGAIVGLGFWDMSGGIAGGIVGYFAYQLLVFILTGISSLLNRRRP